MLYSTWLSIHFHEQSKNGRYMQQSKLATLTSSPSLVPKCKTFIQPLSYPVHHWSLIYPATLTSSPSLVPKCKTFIQPLSYPVHHWSLLYPATLTSSPSLVPICKKDKLDNATFLFHTVHNQNIV